MFDAIPSSPVQVGDVVASKYRIERLLGRGGMGLVFEATHVVLKQRCALKFLATGHSEPGNARFLREAQALASLRGQHAVRVMDVGTLATGVPYFVMEYLEGVSFRQLLEQRGPLPVGEAVAYLLQACAGMAEAHGRGIVHRDLKPSNLFLARTEDGSNVLKVLDFGISKLESQSADATEASITDTGELLGSPKYMAPEQIRGAKTIEPRTDIWALGVIAYELIAGRAPFVGDTVAAVLASVSADTPAVLRSHRSDVPPALDAAITRCLQKQVELRFANVVELARALAPFALGGEEQAERLARSSLLGTAASKKASESSAGMTGRDATEGTGTLRSVFGERPAAPAKARLGWALGAGGASLALGGAAWLFWGLRTQPHDDSPQRADIAPTTQLASPSAAVNPVASLAASHGSATVSPEVSADVPSRVPSTAASAVPPPARPFSSKPRRPSPTRPGVSHSPAKLDDEGTADRK